MKNNQSLINFFWDRFKKDKLGFLSVLYVLLLSIIGVFSYFIIPDTTPYANEMHIEISKMPPGSSVSFLDTPKKKYDEVNWFKSHFFGEESKYYSVPIESYYFEEETLFYVEYSTKDTLRFSGESYMINERFYLFGTDKYGRDFFSRVLLGIRVSFSVGIIAVFISLFLGVILGSFAGYFGGRVDSVIMWLINIVWSVPTLLMVIAITLALGKGFWQIFVAVGLTMWVEVARVVRGKIMQERNLQYVEVARLMNLSSIRIIFRHILPNIISPIIIISAANFASAILIESGLSFLGIGAQPPTPSWGGMIKDHYTYIIMDKSYLAIIPGLCIMMSVLSFMKIGDSIRSLNEVKDI